MPTYRGTAPIVERHIIEIGDKEECGYCYDGDQKFSKARPSYAYKYKYVPDDSETARQLRKEHKISPRQGIPAIIDCKKFADGKQKCDKVIGFDEKEWKDL